MRDYVHIAVDYLNGHWSASYMGRPEVAFDGQNATEAIQRLIDATDNGLDGNDIVALEESTRDGHLEFLIPHVEWWRSRGRT